MSYFRVRLAVNRSTQEAIAVKIVNSDKLVGNQDNLKKEVHFLTLLFYQK